MDLPVLYISAAWPFAAMKPRRSDACAFCNIILYNGSYSCYVRSGYTNRTHHGFAYIPSTFDRSEKLCASLDVANEPFE